MICTKCGEPMRMTDKNTFDGRDIREYKCDACGYEDWEDRGTALWKILSDDREEFEAARAAREAADPDVEFEPSESTQNPANPLRNRFLSWLGLRKAK